MVSCDILLTTFMVNLKLIQFLFLFKTGRISSTKEALYNVSVSTLLFEKQCEQCILYAHHCQVRLSWMIGFRSKEICISYNSCEKLQLGRMTMRVVHNAPQNNGAECAMEVFYNYLPDRNEQYRNLFYSFVSLFFGEQPYLSNTICSRIHFHHSMIWYFKIYIRQPDSQYEM